ncbi:MAG: nucleoside monophosphate kinase [Clostridiales bacterium]|nr:nucleoside monophosphate kinase [Clostridiales bacterium]
MYIILLGPPGSGKGTQASFLEKRLNIKQLSTGELFRAILKEKNHPLYSKLQIINEGKLVPDTVVNQVVEDGLKRGEYKNGALLDGYPRTISQAEALDEILRAMDKKVDIVIDLDVSYEVLCIRLLGRMICPSCKSIYHEEDGIEICPDCDVGLIRRDDDTKEVIAKRFKEYNEKTAPLRGYYNREGVKYITIEIDDPKIQAQEVQDWIIEKLGDCIEVI